MNHRLIFTPIPFLALVCLLTPSLMAGNPGLIRKAEADRLKEEEKKLLEEKAAKYRERELQTIRATRTAEWERYLSGRYTTLIRPELWNTERAKVRDYYSPEKYRGRAWSQIPLQERVKIDNTVSSYWDNPGNQRYRAQYRLNDFYKTRPNIPTPNEELAVAAEVGNTAAQLEGQVSGDVLGEARKQVLARRAQAARRAQENRATQEQRAREQQQIVLRDLRARNPQAYQQQMEVQRQQMARQQQQQLEIERQNKVRQDMKNKQFTELPSQYDRVVLPTDISQAEVQQNIQAPAPTKNQYDNASSALR